MYTMFVCLCICVYVCVYSKHICVFLVYFLCVLFCRTILKEQKLLRGKTECSLIFLILSDVTEDITSNLEVFH